MSPLDHPPPAAISSAWDPDAFAILGLETDLVDLLFDCPSACLAIVDGTGRMAAINGAGRLSLGISEDETPPRRLWPDPWPQAARQDAIRALRSARAGKVAKFDVSIGVGTEMAREFAVEVRPLRGKMGDVAATLAAWRDSPNPAWVEAGYAIGKLQAQLRAAAERETAMQEALARSERVHALGELIATIAHDLNNVLASAASALRIMARSPKGHRDADVADRGHEAIDRGVRLVRQMLDFAPGAEDQPSVIDVAGLLRGLEPVVRSIVGAAVGVSYDLAEDLWPTELVAARLESVTLSLAANARDAMPGGGALQMVGRNVAPSACPEGLASGEYIRIDFVEYAEGRAVEVSATTGNSSFSAKEWGRPAGLGLASAFKLAEDAGGRCFVASLPRRGAILSLYLPRLQRTTTPESLPPAL